METTGYNRIKIAGRINQRISVHKWFQFRRFNLCRQRDAFCVKSKIIVGMAILVKMVFCQIQRVLYNEGVVLHAMYQVGFPVLCLQNWIRASCNPGISVNEGGIPGGWADGVIRWTVHGVNDHRGDVAVSTPWVRSLRSLLSLYTNKL